jgi:hypothetical protein
MHKDQERTNGPEYVCGMNNQFVRHLQDRYEVIYDWPSPMGMIPTAEATIHAENNNDH